MLASSITLRAQTATEPPPVGKTQPRFASLKSDRVNLRQGPSTDNRITWVFRRVGLPVEVVHEFEGWRQVRDAEGTTGWVLQSSLSSRRTVLVLPWDARGTSAPPAVPLRDAARETASVVVNVEAGVIASLVSCDSRWCQISVDRYRGWIEQKKLWGVYENERVE